MIQRDWRIVFMGTPSFAVPALQFLLESGYPIAGVVTAPDKPGGRGLKQVISSPVKQFALQHGLPVLQPRNLKSKAFFNELQALQADIQVVVAFRMLPEVIWSMPPKGTINLHGSLLPAYRGAAPIQWAVIRGEKITGITTFFLQHAIDTGQILLQREIPILEEDTSGNVHDRMMYAGAGLLLATIDGLRQGGIIGREQDEAKVSHAPKLHHHDGKINWHAPVRDIYNFIRGMSPYPGAWTILDGQEIKIWSAHIADETSVGIPGTILQRGKSLVIQAQSGAIEVNEVQLGGKRKMNTLDFLNGYTIKDWSAT